MVKPLIIEERRGDEQNLFCLTRSAAGLLYLSRGRRQISFRTSFTHYNQFLFFAQVNNLLRKACAVKTGSIIIYHAFRMTFPGLHASALILPASRGFGLAPIPFPAGIVSHCTSQTGSVRDRAKNSVLQKNQNQTRIIEKGKAATSGIPLSRFLIFL